MTHQTKGPASAEADPQRTTQTSDPSKFTRNTAKFKRAPSKKAINAEFTFLLAARGAR